MPTWVYKAGKPATLVTRSSSPRGSDPFISLPFKKRMVKALYGLECEQGSKFQIPGYSKETLKKVWMDGPHE